MWATFRPMLAMKILDFSLDVTAMYLQTSGKCFRHVCRRDMGEVSVKVTVKSISLCGILIYEYLTHKLIKSHFKGNR